MSTDRDDPPANVLAETTLQVKVRGYFLPPTPTAEALAERVKTCIETHPTWSLRTESVEIIDILEVDEA